MVCVVVGEVSDVAVSVAESTVVDAVVSAVSDVVVRDAVVGRIVRW